LDSLARCRRCFVFVSAFRMEWEVSVCRDGEGIGLPAITGSGIAFFLGGEKRTMSTGVCLAI
jgi:hypothetical protein